MPRYSGPGLAAGALSGALSSMFEGMAKGEALAPQVANSWQQLRTRQQEYDQTGKMNPLRLTQQEQENAARAQDYEHATQMNPLRVEHQRVTNRGAAAQAGLGEEELGYRPTLRQHQGAQEQRQAAQEGRQVETHGVQMAEAGRQEQNYARARQAQGALQQWAAKYNNQIDLSNPTQLRELNALMAQYGPDLGQNPLVKEGAALAAPPGSPDALTARLLARDPSTWTQQERDHVEQFKNLRSSQINMNNALANMRDKRAGFWKSKFGFGGMETDKLMKHWMDLNAKAKDNINLLMKDMLGTTDGTQLGSTLDERVAGYEWLKNLYLAGELQRQPMLKEFVESQAKQPFPSSEQVLRQIPEHLKERASKSGWFKQMLNSALSGVGNVIQRFNTNKPTPLSPEQDPLKLFSE